ncbi:sulfatase [Aeoliella sp.]|uniref:sulfatase n=1 Tax=Aeoliella sp. TaxID=2795800 RepID=UPI003CCC4233
MRTFHLLHSLTLVAGFLAITLSRCEAQEPRRPDVLMIVVDDLNDWNTLLNDDAPIELPNLERLAKRGVLFTRAYCASPACNPSRVATLTGLRPSTSGVYGNKTDWRRGVGDRKTIMQQFREAGYHVAGAGKIFHHQYDGAFHDPQSFDDFQPMKPQLYPPEKLNQAPEYGSENTDWGTWPPNIEDSIDFHTANYCSEKLRNPPADKPMFLACGIYKPHSPFFAPAQYQSVPAGISMPALGQDDLDDLPSGAAALLKPKRWFWQGMTTLDQRIPGSYREFIESYAACARFADDQIGRVLSALDKSPRRDNTLVVLWSDHGFHLGEKEHIEKFALWEKSNHIPFIVAQPGVTPRGATCEVPVDMTCLYPTLLEQCGLPADDRADGQSISKLLENPSDTSAERVAVMTYLRGNHAVRSPRWRYIRYADGTEELYDHTSDPHEWTNLAAQEQYRDIIAQHRQWLPKSNAAPVRDLRKP